MSQELSVYIKSARWLVSAAVSSHSLDDKFVYITPSIRLRTLLKTDASEILQSHPPKSLKQ